jgi:hypothetical protein
MTYPNAAGEISAETRSFFAGFPSGALAGVVLGLYLALNYLFKAP